MTGTSPPAAPAKPSPQLSWGSESERATRRELGPIAPWAYALSLVLWASTWHLRNSVLMSWSPIEPIWVGTAAVVLCVLHRMGQPLRLHAGALAPVLLLVVAFTPGAIRSPAEGYGPIKLTEMAFVTLPVMLAAIWLLDTREAKKRWLWAQAGMGLVVAAAALLYSDPLALLATGRLTLNTVDTISTGRLVGIGAVVLMLLGLTSLRRYWWALLPAAFLGVVVLQIGSRGPVLFLALSVALALLLARAFTRRRLVPLVILAALLVAAFDFLASGGAGGGGARVLASSRAGFTDIARIEVLQSAVEIGYAHPGGIGWGAFAEYSEPGAVYANDQGRAYAHNVLAEAFSEGGLVALLALVVLIGLVLWRLYRASADPVMALLLGTTLYWMWNAFVSSDVVGNRFLWISLACGLTATLAPAARRETATASSAPPPG